jgi:hypothetical protein
MSAKIKTAGPSKAPSPSEQAVRAGRPEFSDTDALGRLIVLRKPTTWEKFELPRILGASSINPGWIFQAQMILHVKRIGEDTDVFFTTERELKAIVESLGDEGMETVEKLFIENFMQTGEAAKDEIKN